MEYVWDLFGIGELPVITAFLLGVLVALHPCSMAANMAAMGYVARDVASHRRVFRNGLLYVAGRILSYTVLGAVLIAVVRSGSDIMHVSEGFDEWGERVLVVILIGVGLWMLLNPIFHRHEHVPEMSAVAGRLRGAFGCFLLGMLLALAFCPESAIVYFGMLIPMSAGSSVGYLLPAVFAMGTSLPVVIIAWAFAYGITGIPVLHARLDILQRWTNAIVGIVFVAAGVFCMLF